MSAAVPVAEISDDVDVDRLEAAFFALVPFSLSAQRKTYKWATIASRKTIFDSEGFSVEAEDLNIDFDYANNNKIKTYEH